MNNGDCPPVEALLTDAPFSNKASTRSKLSCSKLTARMVSLLHTVRRNAATVRRGARRIDTHVHPSPYRLLAWSGSAFASSNMLAHSRELLLQA